MLRLLWCFYTCRFLPKHLDLELLFTNMFIPFPLHLLWPFSFILISFSILYYFSIVCHMLPSSAFLIRSGSRRLGDHEVCSISLESGSLCTRGSKKRTIKKRWGHLAMLCIILFRKKSIKSRKLRYFNFSKKCPRRRSFVLCCY